MRQGQQNNKRMRGRNRKGPNPLSRSYESNGPDVKIRGTALHIAEKYVQLARDAQASGDRVAAESYLQHAEHYYRIVAAAQAQMPQPQPVFRSDEEGDEDEERGDRVNGNGSEFGNDRQPFAGGQAPAFLAEGQPYINGQGQLEDERPEPNEDNRFEPREGFGEAAAYGRDAQAQNEPRQFNRPRPAGGGGFNREGQGGERQGQGPGPGYNREGGGEHSAGYRGGRRRRPYRERFSGGEPREGGGEQQAAPAPATPETPPGDD
jgi:hypothetical protein